MVSATTQAALLVLGLVFAVRGENTDIGASGFLCSLYANGCSTPFNMDVWYKKEFTPACDIHDVCYRCGARWSISRARCDSIFRSDMLSVCPRQRNPLACTFLANTYHGLVVLGGASRYRVRGNTPNECNQSAIRTICLKKH